MSLVLAWHCIVGFIGAFLLKRPESREEKIETGG